MLRKFVILLNLVCLVCFCGCGAPSKEPVIPTPDGIVCNNDVFADLETSSVLKVGYAGSGAEVVYREDIVYDFVKLLKEATCYEATREDTETIYGFLQFEIILKNGTTYELWFKGDYLDYNGHTYTGYQDDFLENLRALFKT